MSAPNQPSRLRELDALRGLAALVVVLFHYTWQAGNIYPAAKTVTHGLAWGHYGVQLFFAISGFVIFMTLQRTASAADFAVSRFARLFPAYWLAVLLTEAGTIALGAGSLAQPGAIVLANLTMLEGFLYLPAVDGVYWSLTVELGFYACMLALWRLRLLERIEAVLLCWIALKLLWWQVPALPSRIGMVLVVDYIPWFAIGVAAWRVRDGARRWAQQWPFLALGLVAVLAADGAERGAVYVAVGAAFAALTGGHLAMLDWRALVWLGAISYPLYLVHQSLGYALIARLEALGAPPVMALIVTLAAALFAAHVIHRLIEQPALAAIRRWWRSRLQPVPA